MAKMATIWQTPAINVDNMSTRLIDKLTFLAAIWQFLMAIDKNQWRAYGSQMAVPWQNFCGTIKLKRLPCGSHMAVIRHPKGNGMAVLDTWYTWKTNKCKKWTKLRVKLLKQFYLGFFENNGHKNDKYQCWWEGFSLNFFKTKFSSVIDLPFIQQSFSLQSSSPLHLGYISDESQIVTNGHLKQIKFY